jgi:hypothetical protein
MTLVECRNCGQLLCFEDTLGANAAGTCWATSRTVRR